MAWAWVAPVAEAVVSIIGSIFSNKSKSDAQKTSAKMSADALAQQKANVASNIFQSYVKGQNPRFIELGRKLKKSAMGGPGLTPAEKAEYDKLKAEDVAVREGVDIKITNAVGAVQTANPITATTAPPDGGFLSGRGNSDNPFGVPEVTITSGSSPSPKMLGMSPLLLLGIAGAGAGIVYSQTRGKNRRR